MQSAAVSVRHHVLLQNVVQLRYTPLVEIHLVRKSQLILHVFSYPLSELGWQILEHWVVLAICVLEPHAVRGT
jgi:hypothetical protein